MDDVLQLRAFTASPVMTNSFARMITAHDLSRQRQVCVDRTAGQALAGLASSIS